MDSYSLDEAAHLLKPTPDYFSKTLEQLRNMILFAGKAHPILKPCVFFPEPVSMRLAHRNANIYVQESGIEHTMKSVNALPDDPAEAARQKRVDRHWPEDALTPFKYPQVMCQGLFELTFYPEHMDMAEVKESGRIQLYRGKAVRAPLANAAVDRIMNGWYAMSREEVSRAKARTRQEIGDIVILTQGDLHYLVDAPVSIPLSDIRITDKMLTEYAASEGIKLPSPPIKTASIVDQAAIQPTIDFNFQDILPVRFIGFYTGGHLGPECTALFFAHKQGIDWNRRMEAEDKLTAYHWQYGKTTAIKRTEWESVLLSIQSLSERYNKTERHFDEWRTAALKLLPVAFVRRSEFDAAYQRAMSPERITFLDQSRGFERLTGDEDKEARQTTDTPYISPELLDIVFEGFNVSPATFHSSPEQTAQKATQPVKEKKEATTTDISKKMSALKEGKIKANTKAVDKLLAAYHGDTGKKASDHNDLLRHMREHPTLYPLAGFGKDGDVDRYFWLKVSSGAAKEHFSKKQIVRKIVVRLKNNEYLTKESLVEKNM